MQRHLQDHDDFVANVARPCVTTYSNVHRSANEMKVALTRMERLPTA